MGGQVSVESVDIADVRVCDLDEGGVLGFLAPPRSEKPGFYRISEDNEGYYYEQTE